MEWVARAGSTASDIGWSVAVEPGDANVYVVGQYGAAMTVRNSGDTSVATLGYTGGTNAFLIKYGSDGSYKWSANLSATTGAVILNSVKCDPGGNVFVGGQYNSTVSIRNKDGTVWGTRTYAGNAQNGLVVKYNSEGSVQ